MCEKYKFYSFYPKLPSIDDEEIEHVKQNTDSDKKEIAFLTANYELYRNLASSLQTQLDERNEIISHEMTVSDALLEQLDLMKRLYVKTKRQLAVERAERKRLEEELSRVNAGINYSDVA